MTTATKSTRKATFTQMQKDAKKAKQTAKLLKKNGGTAATIAKGIKLCQHGINEKFCKECAPQSKPSLTAAVVSRHPELKKEPKVHQGKHPAIENGGTTICNEQVGIHFRVKQGLDAPSAGDLVLVKVGKQDVVLVVRHTQECVNGETLVQAFTGLYQGEETPAYKILASAKGESVQVFWHH